MINILVVDDHITVREGTKAILETEENFKVSFFCPPFSKLAIQDYDFSSVDVILMDLNLGDDSNNGIELSKEILKVDPSKKIILYTGYNVVDYWDEAVQIGIYGVLSKSEDKKRIVDYIYHTIEGRIVVDFKRYQDLMLNKSNKLSAENSKDAINEREKAILKEVEKGLTNQEIADKLHLSKRSIEYSLTNIYGKLNIGTRTEAVLIAKSEGYID